MIKYCEICKKYTEHNKKTGIFCEDKIVSFIWECQRCINRDVENLMKRIIRILKRKK